MHTVLVLRQLRVNAADVQIGATEAAHFLHCEMVGPTDGVHIGQTDRVIGQLLPDRVWVQSLDSAHLPGWEGVTGAGAIQLSAL